MKKQLLKAVSLSVTIFLASWSFGQSVLQPPAEENFTTPAEKCATQLIHERRMETDPAYAQMHQQVEDYIATHQFEKVGGQYRIPVVVHIAYYNSGLGLALYNISDNQIRDAIKKVNKQYRNMTTGNSQDIDVELVLAVKDPSGNCTTGITRDNVQGILSSTKYNTYVASGVQAATTTIGITDDDIKTVNQWPATQYFNIWLVPEFDNSDGGAGVQGYASLATSHGTTYDGSVMLGLDFTDPNSTTLVHELGHTFNLYHTFQGDGTTGTTCPTNTNCNTQGDLVCDTPPHKRSQSDCNSTGTNSCDGNSSNALFVYNYMDYSSCGDRFTAGQKTRMQTAISGIRGSFLAANGNTKLVPPMNGATVTAVRADKVQVCSGQTIQLFDATSCSPNDYINQTTGFPGFTYSWSVTNGTNTYTSTNQNPVFTPAIGTYSVTLTITHISFGTITSTTPNVFKVVGSPVTACTPQATGSNSGETVAKVSFNTIFNNTSVIFNGGYQDYLCSINTSVVKGNVYPLTVNAVNINSGYREYVRVDIDWNNDGDFGDTGEGSVLTGNNATLAGSGVDITANITIPTYAVEGVLLRMRVIGELGQASNPISTGKLTCSTAYNYGDIEDYGIYVIPSVACPTALAQPTASSICANTNTSFTASFNNSPASFQWQVSTNGGGSWTNLTNTAPYSNVTTATLNITAATTAISTYQYRCVGTNTCGNGNSSGATLTVTAAPSAPTITAGGVTTFCSGGSVVLTSSAGSGNTWSNGSTNPSITVTASGTYTVTRTSGSCTSLASTGTTVTVNPIPSTPTITAGGSTTFCSGGSVVLTSSAGSGNTWSNGSTNPSITVTTSGTYTVTTAAAGCTSPASTGTIVTVNPTPSAPTITAGGVTTFCSGGSVVLTSSAGSGNTWSNGSNNASITVTTSGTYTVTRASGGCTSPASAGVSVTVNPTPSAPTITAGGSTTFCSGGSVVLTSSAGSGNTWSNGSTNPSITVTTPGTYTVTTSAAGCTSPASVGTTVTVNPTPSAPTITAGGVTTFCSGGSVVLTSSAGSGNTWSNGSTNPSITVTTPGTYTVTRASGGCTSPVSTGVSVTVNPTPSAPTITAGGSTTFCSGGSVVLTSSAGSGNTWSNGSTNPSIAVTTSGTYTVTTAAAGCTSPASAGTTVTVNPTPSAPTITAGGSTTFCSGGSVVLTSSAGSGNTWSNGSTNPSITVTTSGTYTVTTAAAGCTSPASTGTTVTVNPVPAITAGTLTNPTNCGSANGSVAVNGSGTGTLSWSGAGSGTLTNVTLPSSIGSLAGGAYNITFTPNSSSCVSNTLSTTLTSPGAPSAPTITAGGSTTICQGGSVVLTSSAGSGNTWSDGSTNPAITVNTAGTYTVTATSGSCTSVPSNAITVVVNTPVTPMFNAVGPYCSGSAIPALTTTSANGVTGTWSPAINNTATTAYTFTPGSGQCANTGSTSITVNPLPGVSFGAVPQLCIYNSPVTLTQGSPAGGTYSGTGVSGSQFDPATAGLGTISLSYSYTDGNGCTNTSQSSVTVDACLGLDELVSNPVLIYPNPTNGTITIDANQQMIQLVEVYDAFGKLVYLRKANESIIEKIDLTFVASGVYTVRVSTNTNVQHLPVVINR